MTPPLTSVDSLENDAGSAMGLFEMTEEDPDGRHLSDQSFSNQPAAASSEETVEEQDESFLAEQYFAPTDPVLEPGAKNNARERSG